jgi:hypothetical protein
VEVIERRTLLVSGLFRRRRKEMVAAPVEAEPVVPAAAPVRRPAVVAPAPAAVKETPVVQPAPAPEPVAVVKKVDGELDMLDALRKARKKARGRTE